MSAKSKKPAATETHLSIAEQTEAFLKAGGKIQHIAKGVSGRDLHPATPPGHSEKICRQIA